MKALSAAELVDWVASRVERRAPCAVVRFGDGEEEMLRAQAGNRESMALATSRLIRESGRKLSAETVLEVKAAVEEAFEEADVLGILFGHELVEGRMNRLTALYAERARRGRRAAALASCHLHHQVLDALPAMLADRPLSVVSCRDVKQVLEAEWQLRDVAVYQVPSQHVLRDVDGAYEAAMHDLPIWPDAHAHVLRELTVRERGEVFLIGAGVFGKDLCIRIRERGGIALDMGSALDRLARKPTRGFPRRVALMHRDGMSAAEIAARFEDHFGAKLDTEKIRRLTEGAASGTGSPFDVDSLLAEYTMDDAGSSRHPTSKPGQPMTERRS